LAEIGPDLFADPSELDEAESHLRMRVVAFAATSVAAALARRNAGSSTPPSKLLAAWRAAAEQCGPMASLLLQVQAACDDPGLRAVLESDARPPSERGMLCGLVGDAELDARVRAALDGVERDWFEEGWKLGTRDRLGQRSPTYDLDEDTLLGASLSGSDPVDSVSDPAPAPAGTLARWQFGAIPARRAGGARSATMLGGRLIRDESGNDGVVRLAPRESDVRLCFTLSERPAKSVDLVLDHGAAARGSYPFGGEVALEIEVDGRLVQSLWLPGAQRRSRPGPCAPPVARLLALVFDPGEHEIVLRMGPLSTTTYRLYEVLLRTDP
jgi:hypothetical protein